MENSPALVIVDTAGSSDKVEDLLKEADLLNDYKCEPNRLLTKHVIRTQVGVTDRVD